MKKIRVLADDVAQKIAAGEVVERPVSVVKELVENALDAGARDIRVELLEGGKSLIRVVDDGAGMGPEDALLCFSRHATSKIATEADLDRISTLGFRGEALASIAAISRLVLKTYDGEGEKGTQVTREGERLAGVKDVAFPRGTSIEVRDLFFNLPARRKFLRSDRAELSLVVRYLLNAALTEPEIRFILVHGSREVLHAPPVAGLKERIYQLYGKSVLEGLAPLDYGEEGGQIEGFASRPLAGRADRSHQFFFVNRRPVRDRILQAALNQAYMGRLEKDKSAEAFVFLRLPPGDVDVNVHPAKTEVRFRDSQAVFRLVVRAVEAAAASETGVKAVYPKSEEGRSATEGARIEEPGLDLGDRGIEPAARGDRPAGRPDAAGAGTRETGPRVLGQYLNMYIVAADTDGVLVIDQHNAHERVLFDKYREIDRQGTWPRKTLLVPIILDLSPSQAVRFEAEQAVLADLGFLAEPMSGGSLALKEFPDIFDAGEARSVFLALLEEESRDPIAGRRDKFLATLACKTAVKAGEPLPFEKMAYLVEELFKSPRPGLCPHGRPVVVRLERGQIERGLRRAVQPPTDD